MGITMGHLFVTSSLLSKSKTPVAATGGSRVVL
jgi:hypothetical protein